MNSSNQTTKMLSISIVSHGQSGLVKRLLRSIHNNEDYKNIEIFITENSHDEPVKISDLPFPNTQIFVNSKPKGFATNHNRAISEAQGEYFCLLNPDVIFTEAIFTRLIRNLDLNRGQIVAPLVLNSEMKIQDSFRKIPTVMDLLGRRIQERPISIPAHEKFIHPQWIAGIFLLMGRGTYSLLGGLDERFYLYFEDVDLGCRARLEGMKLLIDTRCSIIHDGVRASRSEFRYLLRHLQSAIRFYASDVYRKTKILDQSKVAER